MTFGEYIKHRREELGLHQEGLGGFGQTYISAIELGNKRPTKRETICRIAKALQLSDSKVNWLWAYSLFNCDPREYFGRNGEHPVIHQARESYIGHDAGISIQLGETPKEIVAKLGQPTKRIQAPTKTKWIYETEGVHIVFVSDQVVDVEFK